MNDVSAAATGRDLARIRADFPILSETVHGKPLVFLDNAASAQKPRQVFDAERDVYEHGYANIHRGVHYLSQVATQKFEESRAKVRAFLNAPDVDEIVFVRGATEAINLVAHSYGRAFMEPGDEVVISVLEHHSNIVPWQMLRDERGIVLKAATATPDGMIDLDSMKRMIGPKTKLVAITHMSNALGTIQPVDEIVAMAKQVGAHVLIDGCQAVPHMPVDVQALGCDFYVFSGHKLYGPTGIGVLWGRGELLSQMPPYQGGGEMIARVSIEKTRYKNIPHRFEAGTPAIIQGIGLGAAIDYVNAVGFDWIAWHERDLLDYAMEKLRGVNSLTMHGQGEPRGSILSFTMEGAHPHDIGTILDDKGVAVRAGHHCAEPLMDFYGLKATTRASFGLYNTREEVDALVDAIGAVQEIFG
ncbi:MAG: cysteine desulfurase [Acetobacterales bacterium]